MFTTTIAGLPFLKPDLSKLKVGDVVLLAPEPENRHDPNAIRVAHKSARLGYIPRSETHLVGDIRRMYIHKIEPENKWKEITISTEAPKTDATDLNV